ncbi:MAG TPA: hypothetical protein VGU20_24110 [Stellaceae bacterium]|nr:hypothetical protein [Stellaceae bacterium]
MDRALGIHRARENQWPSVGPLIQGDIAPVLRQISELLKTPLLDVANAMFDQETIDARDEWRTILTILDTVGELLEHVFGKHAFAFKNAGQFLRELDQRGQALQIVLWHLIRTRLGLNDRINEITKLVPVAASAAFASEHLVVLREQDPKFAATLTPKRLRGALRNPEKMSALKAELRDLAANNHPDQKD